MCYGAKSRLIYLNHSDYSCHLTDELPPSSVKNSNEALQKLYSDLMKFTLETQNRVWFEQNNFPHSSITQPGVPISKEHED